MEASTNKYSRYRTQGFLTCWLQDCNETNVLLRKVSLRVMDPLHEQDIIDLLLDGKFFM